MSGIIAVHCGAGNHKNHHDYNKLSKKACRMGMEVLRRGGNALDAIKAAITVLEDNPLTNCGYGSNLTSAGTVEGDASVMDGKSLTYGGCGAVKKLKNPIHLAYDICTKQTEVLPLGLIPPSLLVGRGALEHGKNAGLRIVKASSMVSVKALRQYKKYKQLLENHDKEAPLDTVGAVCMDGSGHVAAGCSSGGILLKKQGRIGQAAVYASGAWADSFSPESDASVATSTSGCGEHLVRTQLAKEVAEDVKKSSCPTMAVSKSITEKFLNSRYLHNVDSKMCGALVLHVNNQTGDIAVVWGHTTQTMSVGFMEFSDKCPKAMMSELPNEVSVGTAVNVGGSYFYKKHVEA